MTNVPLYQLIASKIKEKIINKEYKSYLPSEMELCKKYSASRITIRSSLDLLTKNGLILKQKGQKTKIIYTEEPKQKKIDDKISGFHEEVIDPRVNVLQFKLSDANNIIAEKLNIKVGDKIYANKRILYSKNTPLCIEESFLPVNIFPDFSLQNLNNSIIKYIKEKGFTSLKTTIDVTAISANKTASEYLNLKNGSALLKTSSILKNNNEPIEFFISTYNPKYTILTYEKFLLNK